MASREDGQRAGAVYIQTWSGGIGVDVAMAPPPVTAAAPAPSAAVEAPVVADYVLGHCFALPPDDGPRFKRVKVSGPSPLDQGKGKSMPRNKGKGRAEPMWMRTSD